VPHCAARSRRSFPANTSADVVGAAYPSRIVYGPGTNDPLVVYDRDGSGYTQLHYFITDGGGRLVSYTDSTGKDQRLGYGHVYADRAINAGAVNNAESFGGSGSETAGLSDVSFFRNRYYDQRTGRWLTEDPIGVAGGANLYQYSGNSSVP
jgi:RHS repeat-associated protein